MRIILRLVLLILLGAYNIQAQQQPMYTQYMFNGLALNPAYAGSHESMSITLLGRKQWVGMDGAPSSQTLAIHTPIKNEKIGLGVLATNDKIGITKQSTFQVAYSYRLPIGNGKLSMGLFGGVINHSSNFTELYLGPGFSDPAFEQDVNEWLPTAGTGLYYYSTNYYLGISAPQLITSKNSSGLKQTKHYFINGGYVFDLTNSLKLKPSTLVKLTEGAPVSIDINCNLLINEVLWIGASYRSFESISALFELQLTDQLRFGYAYDFPVGSDLSKINTGSHELMINYSFTFYKSQFVSPRRF